MFQATVPDEVGQIARGTVRFCAQMGGQPPARHVLNRMAAMGTSGKHESNCERDLQNIMKDLRVKCKIETMKVTVNVPQRGTAEEYELPVIFPDTLAAALWDCGEDIFRHFMFGTTNARKYWKHCTERCSWFQGHPSSSYARKSCMVPLSLYGDEVQSFKNTEAGIVEILAWSSDFTAGHVPLERYMPILCISEHHVHEKTWDDVWSALIPRLVRMCSEDTWPWSPSGYRFMISSLQGDLKWLNQKFSVNAFNSNELCSRCRCCKSHADAGMTVGDMRVDAAHRSTMVSHAEFLQQLPAERRTQESIRILC